MAVFLRPVVDAVWNVDAAGMMACGGGTKQVEHCMPVFPPESAC